MYAASMVPSYLGENAEGDTVSRRRRASEPLKPIVIGPCKETEGADVALVVGRDDGKAIGVLNPHCEHGIDLDCAWCAQCNAGERSVPANLPPGLALRPVKP